MKTKIYSVFRKSHSSSVLLAMTSMVLGSGWLDASSLLVNWGGDYLQHSAGFSGSYTTVNGLDLDGDSSTDDSRSGYAYNAASPAVFSPPSPYAGVSGTFYGGFVVNSLNTDGDSGKILQPNAQGVHQDGPDHIKFETQTQKTDHTFALFTYWDKSDFLNGGSGGTISLDNLSKFSLSIRNSTNVQDDIHLHMVIRQGSQFYVSEGFFGGTGASVLEPGYLGVIPDGGTAEFFPTMSELGWKAYNPDGLDLQWAHGAWGDPVFDDITGVGFYFDTLAFTQNNSNLEITDFSFTAVPEPGSAALALGALGTLLLLRRRS